MKRAGQAEGGLIGGDSCTYRCCRAADRDANFPGLLLALPQDPAVGRASREQGTNLGGGLGAGRTQCRGMLPACGHLGRGMMGTHPTEGIV